MKALDPNMLKDIFSKRDEENIKDGISEVINDSPGIVMSMIINGVYQYAVTNAIMEKKYGDTWKSQKKNIKSRYYKELISYLDSVGVDKIQSFFDKNSSESRDYDFPFDSFTGALKYIRTYFEELECYEDCATIQKYLKIFSTTPKE